MRLLKLVSYIVITLVSVVAVFGGVFYIYLTTASARSCSSYQFDFFCGETKNNVALTAILVGAVVIVMLMVGLRSISKINHLSK